MLHLCKALVLNCSNTHTEGENNVKMCLLFDVKGCVFCCLDAMLSNCRA